MTLSTGMRGQQKVDVFSASSLITTLVKSKSPQLQTALLVQDSLTFPMASYMATTTDNAGHYQYHG